MPQKYRNQLLHNKMLDALESARMQDRWEWIRVTSYTGTIFEPQSPLDRSAADGTQLLYVIIALCDTCDRGNWAACHREGRHSKCQGSLRS